MRPIRPAFFVPVLALLAPGLCAAAETPASEPVLKVLSPGRPPLKALRYRVAAGQRGTLTMSMTTATTMAMGGQAMPTASTPEMRSQLAYRVTGVTPEGDIRYDFDIGGFEAVADPSVPAAVVEATKSALAGLKGLRGQALVTSRGITRQVDIQVPDGAPAQLRAMTDSLRQSIRQFSAPLPEQPVGVGARWETTQRITLNGLTVEQTARNELTSLDGDRGRLAVAISQTAPSQALQSPDMPAGAKVDVLSLSSKGEAGSEFDLTRLVPLSATVRVRMQMKMRVQAGEQKPQDMEVTADISMAATSR